MAVRLLQLQMGLIFAWRPMIASLLGLCLTELCTAQTPSLKDLLDRNTVPTVSFSASELAKEVDGSSNNKNGVSVVAYMVRNDDSYTGDLRVVRYDAATQRLDRKAIKFKEYDLCGGSPLGIQFLGKFAWLSLHVNPSANCLLALNDQLEIQAKIFGFDLTEVGPAQLAYTEGMVHFAPIHAERLRLVDLGTHTSRELYPPQHDTLRPPFEEEHAKHLPSRKTCEASQNDPCDASTFDESIGPIQVLKEGGFTFLANWQASHVMKPNGDSETVASETNQYVYRFQLGKWLFCDVKIASGDASMTGTTRSPVWDPPPCTPQTPVDADMSSSNLNPFPPPELSNTLQKESRDHR